MTGQCQIPQITPINSIALRPPRGMSFGSKYARQPNSSPNVKMELMIGASRTPWMSWMIANVQGERGDTEGDLAINCFRVDKDGSKYWGKSAKNRTEPVSVITTGKNQPASQ